ncbi:ARM repeat-containing protein [Gonapodya prolifera JEL478]|uniref:ARM repeat-containing protein n=1 Tax=Gonapodya prolifera (strain JEL478) TaxID=1344416 RepID=A0A139AC44_GONPJ|nr:ARM repeat-containing protein [Gonapodya prolifera JEL478]|eukprot:KXS13993.1 ARM repeat-containing protein [Gonapodya prolifera JEL478]
MAVYDYPWRSNLFLECLRDCTQSFPHKLGLYGTLSGLINVRRKEAAAEIVASSAAAFSDALATGNWMDARTALRFLGELANANVVSVSSLAALLKQILDEVSSMTASPARADQFANLVISALPWCAATIRRSAPAELEEIVRRISGHVESRRQAGRHLGLAALRPFRAELAEDGAGLPYEQVDELEAIWRQVSGLADEDWKAQLLHRPHESFDDKLTTASPHDLPAIQIREETPETRYPDQSVPLVIFDDSVNTGERSTTLVSLPPLNSPSRYIFCTLISDLLSILAHNHHALHISIAALPEYLDRARWQLEFWQPTHAAVEVVLREALKLPSPTQPLMFYATALGDLFRDQNMVTEAGPALGRAVRTLWERSALGLDVELSRRLAELLAVHLSNFGYQWTWDRWTEQLRRLPSHSIQVTFVRELVERCLRLAYKERLLDETLPQNWKDEDIAVKVLPQRWESADEGWRYGPKGDVEDERLKELATELVNALRSKKPGTAIKGIFDAIREHIRAKLGHEANEVAHWDGDTQHPSWDADADSVVRDVFAQAVMVVGCKSLSHLAMIVERSRAVWNDLFTSDLARAQLMTSLASFFRFRPQLLEIWCGRLINYRVLSVESILAWSLSPDHLNRTEGADPTPWYVLETTLRKVTLRRSQADERVARARDQVAFNQKRRDVGDGDFVYDENGNKFDGLTGPITSGETAAQREVQEAEEEVERMTREQKQAFLSVLQRFVRIITAKISETSMEDVDIERTPWWRWVYGFMRQIGREFGPEIRTFAKTLEITVFAEGDVDSRIMELWGELSAFYDAKIV